MPMPSKKFGVDQYEAAVARRLTNGFSCVWVGTFPGSDKRISVFVRKTDEYVEIHKLVEGASTVMIYEIGLSNEQAKAVCPLY